jgi:hypothetical protein
MSEEYHEKSISFLWGLVELDGDWSENVIMGAYGCVVAFLVCVAAVLVFG